MSVTRGGEYAGPRAYSLEMLARIIRILEQVGAANEPVGVSAIARRTSIPKTTAYRMLENLARQEILSKWMGGYVIGPRMRKLGLLIHDRLSDDLRDLLRPYLVELHVRTGEAVTLGALDSDEMVILDTIRGLRQAGIAPPAVRSPAHCTAIGKLLMAQRADLPAMRALGAKLAACTMHTITDWNRLAPELARIRRSGVAVSNQEHVLGVVDVAMPIVGRKGPIAGVALSRAAAAVSTQEVHAAHRQIVLAASAAIRTLRTPPGSRKHP